MTQDDAGIFDWISEMTIDPAEVETRRAEILRATEASKLSSPPLERPRPERPRPERCGCVKCFPLRWNMLERVEVDTVWNYLDDIASARVAAGKGSADYRSAPVGDEDWEGTKPSTDTEELARNPFVRALGNSIALKQRRVIVNYLAETGNIILFQDVHTRAPVAQLIPYEYSPRGLPTWRDPSVYCTRTVENYGPIRTELKGRDVTPFIRALLPLARDHFLGTASQLYDAIRNAVLPEDLPANPGALMRLLGVHASKLAAAGILIKRGHTRDTRYVQIVSVS